MPTEVQMDYLDMTMIVVSFRTAELYKKFSYSRTLAIQIFLRQSGISELRSPIVEIRWRRNVQCISGYGRDVTQPVKELKEIPENKSEEG